MIISRLMTLWLLCVGSVFMNLALRECGLKLSLIDAQIKIRGEATREMCQSWFSLAGLKGNELDLQRGEDDLLIGDKLLCR